MSGVERHGYMDSQATAQITETIVKERRLQQKYYKEQDAQEKLESFVQEEQTYGRTALDRVGVPEFVSTIRSDPGQHMAYSISKNMWTANPGYISRDGARVASTMKSDYIYGPEEAEFMREQAALAHGKSHNRRQDEFTQYVEASAKQHLLMKGSPAAAPH